MSQAGEGQQKPEHSTSSDKTKEISVVASAHAVVEPDTVMIQRLNTVVANSAVVTSRGSPDVTRFAVLDRYVHGGSLRSRKSNHDPIIGRRANGKRILIIGRWEGVYIARENLSWSAESSTTRRQVDGLLQDLPQIHV